VNLITKGFHVFLAALIAVPLGAGGICCCLTDGLAQEFQAERAVAKAPAASCCSQGAMEAPPAPAEPGPPVACPMDADGEDSCECPVRDTALISATPSALVFVQAAPPIAAAPVAVAAPAPAAVPVAAVPAAPHPPPKSKLYLQHSVLRS